MPLLGSAPVGIDCELLFKIASPMTPEVFALLAAVIFGTNKIIWTYEVRRGTDAWSMMLGLCLAGSILVGLFAPPAGLAALSLWAFLVLLVNGLLWVYGDFFSLKASKFLDPSISRICGSAQYLIVVLAGVMLFSESLTARRGIGLTLILVSLVVTARLSRSIALEGLKWQLASVILSAAARILDNVIVRSYGAETITFTGFFIPGVLYLLLKPSSLWVAPRHLKRAGPWYLLAIMLTPMAYYFSNRALAAGELSISTAILQSDMIVLLVLERVLFGRPADQMVRVFACILCALGAIMLMH